MSDESMSSEPDDIHEISGDDIHETSGDDIHEISGDDIREISGIVKWFNAEKGFGFVTVADSSSDAFLHLSILINPTRCPA